MLSSKYHLTRQFGMQHTESHNQTFFMNHHAWKKYIKTRITKWVRYFDWMVDIPKGHTLLLVRYEDLKANVTKEVKRMLEFLHYRDTGQYVCVYLCGHALHMYVCVYICMYVCLCVYVCMHYIYMLVFTYIIMYVCMYVCVYLCGMHPYVCMCLCMYVCMFVCVCVYALHIYVCTCVCMLRVHICIVLEKIRTTLHCWGVFK